MANRFYRKGREAILRGQVDWLNDTIRVLLIDNTYVPDTDIDRLLEDIPTASIIATQDLSSKTIAGRVFDAADALVTSVPTGRQVIYVVVCDITSDRLLHLWDTSAGFLPLSTDGSNITVQWSNGAEKIFVIGLANGFYQKGLESFGKGEISWIDDTIKVLLVDATYTPNLSTDQFLSDIAAGKRVATSGGITNRLATDGVADADDVVFSSVSGSIIAYVVFFQSTGVEGTSRLIIVWDAMDGLPLTPDGTNITLQLDNDVDKIFRLC